MRLNQLVVAVAQHTGWTLEYIGQLPMQRFTALYRIIEHQDKQNRYRLEYRLGQIMSMFASTKSHKYKPEHFVGSAPKKLEVTNTMTTKKETYSVTLGDGKVYKMATLNVNMMEVVEEEFNKSWNELMADSRAKVVKALVHVMLRPNYPEITRDRIGELLTPHALAEVQKIIIKQAK